MVSVLADAALKAKPPPRVGVGKMVAPRANTTRMEDFEVQRKLGQGSFGVVYAVTRKRDLAKRRTFVIKQVELGPRRSEQEAAIDECRVLSKMDSKYVVKYFESFITKGSKLCIVMEYAPKGTVHGLIQRNKPHGVSEDTSWRLILQSALGLAHIHSLKILHRDVKSENIFLDAKGDAKIGDLGVAKSLKNTEDFGRTLVGTPFYLSPELCDRRPYDAKSDVWSLGVVLYELLTGKPPFRARSQQELFVKILDGSYAPLPKKEHNASNGVSSDMRELVRDMLTTNVSRRVDAKGVATRPASVAKAKALGVDGVFEEVNIGVSVDDASTGNVNHDGTEARKNVGVDRPRTTAASRLGSRLGIYTTDARGNPRPSTTRAGLRAEALAEAERLARENESKAPNEGSRGETDVRVSPSGRRGGFADPDQSRNGNERQTNAPELSELLGRSPAIAAGIAAAAAGGGAAGEAAAARHLAASPRFVTNYPDPVAAAAAATAAQARAARQRALEQASEARRERERARERERQARRDANEEAAARQRRKVAAAAEASATARARLASARARRVALSHGVGGSPTRIGHKSPVSASRPETAGALLRPAGPSSGREAAMAAASRSRAHSARPSRPSAEAREAAAAVAALPEHHHEHQSGAHGQRAFEAGVEDAKLASRRVDAMRVGGYFARNPAPALRPFTAAAGCFRNPERDSSGEREYSERSEYREPVRPLWPSRPSTAAARVEANAGGFERAPFVRPSSAAALRRAAKLCAEIENVSETGSDKKVVSAPKKNALAVDVDALAPLSDVEESPAGLYAAASPSSLFAPFGVDDTFASSPTRYPYGGRLTVAPDVADGTVRCETSVSDSKANARGLDGDDGDAFARALRLCHSAAETAAGVAERLRARDAPEGDRLITHTEGDGSDGGVNAVGEDDGGGGAESETDIASERENQTETGKSGDENDVPDVFPNARDALLSSPRVAPPRSPSRPGSAFGERSVRSSLERFRRRRSATATEPQVAPPEPRTPTLNTHRDDSESDASSDSVVEAILEALLESAEVQSVVDDDSIDDSIDVNSSDESDSDQSDDDDERAARVEALVSQMSTTELQGSALIGSEAFGRLYDALARRAEAAAAAAAAMAKESGTEESESKSDESPDVSGSERSGSENERSFAEDDVADFPDRGDRGSSRSTPKTKNAPPSWSATLLPFGSSVTVAMTPRRLRAKSTKKKRRHNRRRDDDVTFRFAEAEVLALQYARLVSELEKVGRSREGTPEGDIRDGAVRLAAGGPTGR